MEFQNPNIEEKSYYSLSSIICVLSLLIGLSVIGLCVWILGKFHALRKKNNPSEKELELFEKKYEGISVLFEEFDNSSLAKQSAFLIFSLKAIAESLIVALLYDQPLFQAILLQVLTLLLLVYNLVKRPFQSKISLVQQLVLVFSIFICNLLLFIMAAIDINYENFQIIKERTSLGMFWILIMFQFIPLVFFGITIIDGIWRLYKWFSLMRNPKKTNANKSHLFRTEDSDHSFFNLDQSKIHPEPPKIDLETSPSPSLLPPGITTRNHRRGKIKSPMYLDQSIIHPEPPKIDLETSPSPSLLPMRTMGTTTRNHRRGKIKSPMYFAENVENMRNETLPETRIPQPRRRIVRPPPRKVN